MKKIYNRIILALLNKKNKGFTLIETGVCIAIILLLSAISLPAYLQALQKGKEAVQLMSSVTGK